MGCSIISSDKNFSIGLTIIFEQKSHKNSPLLVWCLTMSSPVNCFFEVNIIIQHKFNPNYSSPHVLFHHIIIPKHFVQTMNIVEQNFTKKYLFWICGSMMLPSTKLSFELNNILEHNFSQNYSSVMCCLITSTSRKLSIKMSNTCELANAENYRFSTRCTVIALTVNFSVGFGNILKLNVIENYSFAMACLITSYMKSKSF